MRTFSSLLQLAALGALSSAAASALAVDTSQWKCESCPFEKEGRSGSVQAGVIGVSDDSQKFGDFTGLNKKGAYLDLSGGVRYRGDNGVYGALEANDLGLDTRSIYFDGGREGLYTLKLGYAEIPRFQADGAQTPFIGNGGSRLTLPGGFPAADTASMPLATALQPVDVESKRQRFDAGLGWLFGEQWSTQLTYRRDVRDGVQRIAGSFSANAAQMVAPLDQTTDQLELSASYATRRLQATVAYQLSVFRNGEPSLTWSNPFTPSVPGADTGQLALAPGNQFHQLMASAGYEVTPTIRVSGDIAVGRMTQDESFLAPTVNAALAPTVPALPAQSLQGEVSTFNASARVTAKPIDGLNLTGSYDRNVRDNKTPSLGYPAVTTDMFIGATPRTNQPFSFFQDRFKVAGDYRWPGSLKTSIGVDWDSIERSLQEVVTTRETTLWARMEGRATDNVLLQAKLAHAERDGTTYGIATWIDPPQNPLMRKFYLADRKRDSVGGRIDVTPKEGVSFGLNADYAKDDYSDSTIGLTQARTQSVGADFSAALSDQTSLYAFLQAEQIRSDQAGSQLFAAPDWTGHNEDRTNSIGFGVKHLALGGKLALSADAVFTRMKNDISVNAGVTSPPFPTITTDVDRFRLKAVYQLQKNLSLVGSWWYERYDSADWHLDGVFPATISNLLAFGDQAPRYRVNVLQFAVRYRF
ncbi:MAG TPA: MtrB/PioB family decaheme-associated outer membrane protein [Burkholderiaceae bacterium]|nr:MtrB/PioB family decaheme-associated outer membrane protein [Burkholderiaceae bacterium]